MLDAEEELLRHEPFLRSRESIEESSVVPEKFLSSRVKSNYGAWTSHTGLFIHLGLIIFYTAVTITVLWMNSPQTIYSNASIQNLAITYEEKLFVNLTNNPFAGTPSSAVDEAWDNLLENVNIRVTAGELQHYGQESVGLPEGGGYLAWLGVFHELHCINMLRKWLYRDHYHKNLSASESTHWSSHADHCVDLLRQTSLCHADTSLTTFVWDPSSPKPMFDSRQSRHMCVDFKRLVGSVKTREVSASEIRRVRNPLFKGEKEKKEDGRPK